MASALSSQILKQTLGASSPLLKRSGTLYDVLSVLPKDGIGARVTQSRWEAKGIKDSYYEVTQVRLKDEGRHGKVWGRLIWKGQPIKERDERIRKGLKYSWKLVTPGESASP
ncbi:hypothetical protein FRC03_002397 [Tulasnella sp. 419]|nr:hypothetical protein FRC02_002852 [Tulasnella sp. 418]KAG8963966.1 hypothetical protein FRC03_002397 [Tulasnella sp. 419]